jgi:hypothetical protein
MTVAHVVTMWLAYLTLLSRTLPLHTALLPSHNCTHAHTVDPRTQGGHTYTQAFTAACAYWIGTVFGAGGTVGEPNRVVSLPSRVWLLVVRSGRGDTTIAAVGARPVPCYRR